MKIQNLISGLVLLSAIMLLGTENKVGLKGKIEDASGFGVTSGSLEICKKGEDHKVEFETTIAENGTFILPNLEPGEYEVVVKVQGYSEKTETVEITEQTADLGVITLDEDYITLDPVIIYGKAKSNLIH